MLSLFESQNFTVLNISFCVTLHIIVNVKISADDVKAALEPMKQWNKKGPLV